ncbi:MAG: DUF1223 domain-containing protein [Alphaproteobacteria bacterium]|nr:DUF1223 domain-containing protein [Alphaproteobacteria bacterium]
MSDRSIARFTPPALMAPALTAIGISLMSLTAPALAQDTRPVVVELFTSQGCSSCPPADAFLGDLAQRRNVIALAWHVDYWNYLGWKDPFALTEATQRQRVYGRRLGLPYVYTPQMVIDGRFDERGFDRSGVQDRIGEQADAASRPPVSVSLIRTDRAITARLSSALPREEASVLLVVFDREHRTEVKRGENAGRTLIDFNIVRRVIDLGGFAGTGKDFEIPADSVGPDQGLALLVQAPDQGGVIGAAQLLPGARTGGG